MRIMTEQTFEIFSTPVYVIMHCDATTNSVVGLKRELQAISMRVSKVWAIIVFHCIGVDYILLDSAVLEILYFKRAVGAFLILIFISNPDVENIMLYCNQNFVLKFQAFFFDCLRITLKLE